MSLCCMVLKSFGTLHEWQYKLKENQSVPNAQARLTTLEEIGCSSRCGCGSDAYIDLSGLFLQAFQASGAPVLVF